MADPVDTCPECQGTGVAIIRDEDGIELLHLCDCVSGVDHGITVADLR